nr:PREDICTED: WNT1-inducible-signaling pathway protein 2 [Struthio camelus australis]
MKQQERHHPGPVGEYKHQQDLRGALKPANTLLPPNCLGGDVLKCRQREQHETPAGEAASLLLPSLHPFQVEDDEEGCEVNGRVYRDGEVFQPSCKLQCRCQDGGITCVPLCQEDVRLPTPDCPYPRRVEVPGKCCQEWICETRERPLLQDAMAAPRAPGLASPALPYPCEEWGTEWSACSATCGMGFSTRVSNQNRYCRLETQRRLCMVRPCQAPPGASLVRGRRGRL